MVFVLDTACITEADIENLLVRLDEARIEKIRNHREITAKKTSFGVGLLILWILTQLGLPKDAVRYSKENKPYINDALHISISHSGNYACVAISSHPLGVDLQVNLGYMPHIVKKYYSQNEQDQIYQNQEEFYRIWCQKEAYIKVFGYRDLVDIPSEVYGYHYCCFLVDANWGCVLSADRSINVYRLSFNQIIPDIL